MSRRSRPQILHRSAAVSFVGTAALMLACESSPRASGDNHSRDASPRTSSSTPSGDPVHQEPTSPRAAPGLWPVDFADVVDRVSPSVVGVLARIASPPVGHEPAESRTRTGIGSGLVVGDGRQVLTNHHVVADASSLAVAFRDQQAAPARLVAGDALVDLALLELESSAPDHPPVTFATSPTRPGRPILAIGQPFGLGHTVTAGIVSGTARDHEDLGRPRGLAAHGYWSFIQTDASINIGNSGGPLVDVRGEVVGVTTAVRLDGQGLAFAIPAVMATKFLDEVNVHGRLRHVRLGIRAENATIDDVPTRASTVRVTEVDRNGPAAMIGLNEGDWITAVDGEGVARVSQVAYLAQIKGVGATIELTVERDGRVRTVGLVLGAAEAP